MSQEDPLKSGILPAPADPVYTVLHPFTEILRRRQWGIGMVEKTPYCALMVSTEASSKANSRKLVYARGGRPLFILSADAKNCSNVVKRHADDFVVKHARNAPLYASCDVAVAMEIYYATRRKDLDESIVLDAMQGAIYGNDRQVKNKFIRWGLDPVHPRIEIVVWQIGEESLATGHCGGTPGSRKGRKKKK